jgi:hypothetical protein
MHTTTNHRSSVGRRLAALIALTAVVAAACGGDDDDAEPAATTAATTEPATPATTAAPTTTATPVTVPPSTQAPPATTPPTTAPTTTVPPTTAAPTILPSVPELPDTPLLGVLDTSYTFSGAPLDPELLPAQPGEVTAKWYVAGDVYAVVYEGLDPSVAACPGNSAQTTAGFDFVSNAALGDTGCSTFPTIIESTDTQGVQVCGDRVSYLTLIPSDMIALLYSSIELPVDGDGVGITGFALVEDPATIPAIDPALLSC